MRALYLRSLLVSVSLVGAVSILGISLVSSNSKVWSTTGSYETSKKQFYWSGEILPDHVAYPILMIADRAKLEVAEPLDRMYLQLEYGRDRYESSRALLEKGNPSLALTTLTKAQKYWLQAGQSALSDEPHLNETVRFFTLRTLEYYEHAIETHKSEYGDADRAVVDSLLAEMEAVSTKLAEKLNLKQS